MAFVYRWEDDYGNGPYVGYGMFKGHCRTTGQPTPWEDGLHPGLGTLGPDMVCGFASLTQEREWFSYSERDAMRRRGMALYRYRLGPGQVFYAGRQCVFPRPESMIAERVEVDGLD